PLRPSQAARSRRSRLPAAGPRTGRPAARLPRALRGPRRPRPGTGPLQPAGPLRPAVALRPARRPRAVARRLAGPPQAGEEERGVRLLRVRHAHRGTSDRAVRRRRGPAVHRHPRHHVAAVRGGRLRVPVAGRRAGAGRAAGSPPRRPRAPRRLPAGTFGYPRPRAAQELAPRRDCLVWIDCEMTGLDLDADALIEVACVITDGQLNQLDDGLDIVIKPPQAALDQMGDFVTRMHTDSGLIDELDNGVTLQEAEELVLDHIKRYAPEKTPLCGNSIATDRLFISRDMPRVDAYLHYRMVDVSSIKELLRRWYPRIYFNSPE